jgi:hypothetical protein
VCVQLHCQQSKNVESSVQVLIPQLAVVVDAFGTQTKVAIYTSFAIFVFFGYSLCAPFVAMPFACGQMFPNINHVSFADHHTVDRERMPHRSMPALDENSELPWYASPVSVPSSVPYDHVGEYSVRCMRKRILFH